MNDNFKIRPVSGDGSGDNLEPQNNEEHLEQDSKKASQNLPSDEKTSSLKPKAELFSSDQDSPKSANASPEGVSSLGQKPSQDDSLSLPDNDPQFYDRARPLKKRKPLNKNSTSFSPLSFFKSRFNKESKEDQRSKLGRQKIKKDSKRWKKRLKISLLVFLGIFIIGSTGLTIYVVRAIKEGPTLEEIENISFIESTTIYDRSGEHKLYDLQGKEHRQYVSLDEINQNFIWAIMAAEDDQFYNHPGLDLGGIIKAVCYESSKVVKMHTYGGMCPPRGGSTLTNQLVDNIINAGGLDPKDKYKRKIQEWYLSWKLENDDNDLSKQEVKDNIMELYVNLISFGSMNGVETASQMFYDKPASKLSVAESAILASVINMPTFYSPWGNHQFTELNVTPEEIERLNISSIEELEELEGRVIVTGLRGQYFTLADGNEVFIDGRSDWVLSRMRDLGYINQTTYEQAFNELRELEFEPLRFDIQAPHFVFHVKEILEAQLGKERLEQGGLQVITTLDYDLQQKAEEIVREKAFANEEQFNADNAASVTIESQTGYIASLVGSRDYFETKTENEDGTFSGIGGEVNVMVRKRSPGSSFKPFAYAAAFEKGVAPGSVLYDVKTTFKVQGGGTWSPDNYGGGFSGPQTVRSSLARSLNIPAAKSGIIAGVAGVIDLAERAGIKIDRPAEKLGESISLGAVDIRGIDLAQGYTTFANNGRRVPLVAILEVRDSQGNILIDNRETYQNAEQVIDERVAYLITDVLADAAARGAGFNSNLQLAGRINAAKTGTSNKDLPSGGILPGDTWTAGYTPDYVTVVWAGNNDGSVLSGSATGLTTAGPIWKAIMEAAHEDLSPAKFAQPEGIKTVAVSRLSGKLPPEGLPEELVHRDIFSIDHLPKEPEEGNESLEIIRVEKANGLLPSEFTPKEATEEKILLRFTAYDPERENWQEAIDSWVEENCEEFISELELKAADSEEETAEEPMEILCRAPLAVSEEYTAESVENKPVVTIDSPINGGIVTPPRIDVQTAIRAKNGTQKVEFFWDDELVAETDGANPSTSIRVPGDLERNSKHKIKVVVTDGLFLTGSAEIEVKIGTDDSPPEIEIVFPGEDTEVIAGSSATLTAEVFDEKSAVDRVEFAVNGSRVGIAQSRPYRVDYTVPNSPGDYRIEVTASDTLGNVSTKEQSFKVVTPELDESFSIISPENGSVIEPGEPVNVSVTISEDIASEFENLLIYIKRGEEPKDILAEFSADQLTDSRVFSAAFTKNSADVTLSARVNFADRSNNSNIVRITSP